MTLSISKRTLSLVIVVLGTLLSISAGLYAYKTRTSARSEALRCVNTLQEQCASEDFLRGWNHWQEIRTRLASSDGSESVTEREQASDEFAGLTQRLAGMIPKGSQWDETKRRFTLLPAPEAGKAPAPGATPPPTTIPTPPTK